MGKRIIVKTKEEQKRHNIKFALSLKVKPKAIAKKARVTERTVQNIKRRKHTQRRKGSGRKSILRQSDKLRIINRLRRNPFL